MSERKQWSVCIEIHISPVVEAESAEHAAEIVASPEFNLYKEINQRMADGSYEIAEIWTEGRVP